jgi:hypothetical protein
VTWSRSTVAEALADVLGAEVAGDGVAVFARPPLTLNPPALVVARPVEVLYGVAGLGVDEAQLPVVCIGPMEGEDVVDDLIAIVRAVVTVDPTLGGVVHLVTAPLERGWRAVTIGGQGSRYLAADVVLQIRQ